MKYLQLYPSHDDYIDTGYLSRVDYCETDKHLHYNLKKYTCEVEYIASTRSASQYINTGYYPDASITSIYLDISFHDTFSTTNGAIFWGNDTAANKMYAANFGASAGQETTMYAWFGKQYQNGGTVKNIKSFALTRGILSYTASSQNFSFNGKSVTTELEVGRRANTLKILNNFQSYIARLYGVVIKENNEIIMNLIPVKVNDVGGLYDTITKQVFTSSGTDDFACGPNK